MFARVVVGVVFVAVTIVVFVVVVIGIVVMMIIESSCGRCVQFLFESVWCVWPCCPRVCVCVCVCVCVRVSVCPRALEFSVFCLS